MRLFFLIIVCLFVVQSASFAEVSACKTKIIEKYVKIDGQRKELSLAYIKEHYGIEAVDARISPKIIVVHWTGVDSLELSFRAFGRTTLPRERAELINASALNVGTHFLVDRNGDIYQLLPTTYFARHVIGLNYYSIGIENVGGSKNGLTQEQLVANESLIRCLVDDYPDIHYVIGHYEYRVFENTEFFLEKDAKYRTSKVDPGKDFMKKLRKRINDLYAVSRLSTTTNIKEGK